MKRVQQAGWVMMAALALNSCSSDPKAAVPSSSPTAAAQPVPAPIPADEVFLASGPIVVENQVDVAAQREGVVARIMAEPGTRVKRGQILGTLDDRQINADLEAARAKTRSIEADKKNWESEAKVLESDYERAQKMWDAQLITKEQLEHAKFKAESDQWDVKRVQELLANAQATQRSLQLELEKTSIRAPFEGLVARRYVRAGQRVALGDRLFWVTATAPLQVRFTLPEKFLGRVKTGLELGLTSPDLPSERHKARIIQLSPVVDPSSGTIDVVAEVIGPTQELRPGMTANIQLPNPR
jgi:RND family efflux transporter MFP subunit